MIICIFQIFGAVSLRQYYLKYLLVFFLSFSWLRVVKKMRKASKLSRGQKEFLPYKNKDWSKYILLSESATHLTILSKITGMRKMVEKSKKGESL